MVRVDIVEEAYRIRGGERLEEEGFGPRREDVDGYLKPFRQREKQEMAPSGNLESGGFVTAGNTQKESVVGGLLVVEAVIEEGVDQILGKGDGGFLRLLHHESEVGQSGERLRCIFPGERIGAGMEVGAT
jgi:hypothetical protein